MTPENKTGYRRTFLDRVGPDGIHAPGVWWRLFLISLVPAAGVIGVIRIFGGASVAGYIGSFLVLALFFSALSIFMSTKVGSAFGRLIVPRGKASPYQHDFSFEKALVMQERIGEALASFEERLRMNPEDAATLLEAAELNAGKGSRVRATELFKRLQQLPNTSESHRLNATNRLVDLYLRGETADDAAVKREMEYLVTTLPHTRAATHAREYLAKHSRII